MMLMSFRVSASRTLLHLGSPISAHIDYNCSPWAMYAYTPDHHLRFQLEFIYEHVHGPPPNFLHICFEFVVDRPNHSFYCVLVVGSVCVLCLS